MLIVNRVIRSFSKFDSSTKELIYSAFSEGELERTTFPYQGSIVEGVIYKTEEALLLIPIKTIRGIELRFLKSSEDNEEEIPEIAPDE